MRFLFLLFVSAVACLAQAPTVSNIDIAVTHGCMRVTGDWANQTPFTSLYLEWGKTSALGFRQGWASNTTDAEKTITTCGLEPDTTYFVRYSLTTSAGTGETSCTMGESGVGWTCDPGGSGMLTIHTLAAPAPDVHGVPIPPAKPTGISLDGPPTYSGSTTVTPGNSCPASTACSFPVNACGDLQMQLNACAAADPTLNHIVPMNPALSCAGSFVLPAKSGPGNGACTFRSAAADNVLPPVGVRVAGELRDTLDHETYDSSYDSVMPILLAQHTQFGPNGLQALRGAGTSGWYLLGIRFGSEASDVHRKWTITNIEPGLMRFTTDVPHGMRGTQQVKIGGVQGFAGHGPNGSWMVNVVTSTTFTIYSALNSIFVSPNFTGSWVNGTGWAMHSVGTPIADVSSTTPPIVTTAYEHGLVNEGWSDIVSIAGNVITLAGGHTMPINHYPSEIAGSSVAGYNGMFLTNVAAGNTATITRAPSGTLPGTLGLSCASSCGQIRQKWMLHVAGVRGATGANKNHWYTVIDDTHLQLDDAAGGQTYTGGGSLARDSDYRDQLVSFNNTNSRIVLDRCKFIGEKDDDQFGQKYYVGLFFGASDSALLESYFYNFNRWQLAYPPWIGGAITVGSQYNVMETSQLKQTITVELTQCIRCLARNNANHRANGISWFAQENTAFSDFTMIRNSIIGSEIDMSNTPRGDDRYQYNRHRVETKSEARTEIRGNVIQGNWIDGVNAGWAWAFSVRSDNGYVKDLLFTSNITRMVGSCIQITGTDSFNSAKVEGASTRIVVENSVCDTNAHKWVSSPANLGIGIYAGFNVEIFHPISDFTMRHNTSRLRGAGPGLFMMGFARGEGVVIKDNLTYAANDAGRAWMPSTDLNQNALLPNFTGLTRRQAFESYFPVASEFKRNVFVPLTENSSLDSNFDTTASVNWSKSECDTFWGGTNGWVSGDHFLCVGGASDTATQRFASTGVMSDKLASFESAPWATGAGAEWGKDYQYGHRPGWLFDSAAQFSTDGLPTGHDQTKLELEAGIVRNARAVSETTGQARISYRSADPCVVELDGDGNRRTDNGMSSAVDIRRYVVVTGLASGSTHTAKIFCPVQQPAVTFQVR